MNIVQKCLCYCACLLVVACGGGYEGTAPPIDSSSQSLKVVGAAHITLVPSEMGRVEVSGGTRPYSVASSNTAVALASVSDNILSVAAVRGDLTPITVTVTDAKNTKTSLQVTVTNSPQQGIFTLSERVFSVQPGTYKPITITGGTGPFTAVSLSPIVEIIAIEGNVITVNGVSEGSSAEVKIFDTKGVTQSAFVTVSAPIPSSSGLALFSNLPNLFSLRPHNTVTYTLGGGIPPYTFKSSNPAVLAGEIRGAALILKPGSAGNAIVSITDSSVPTKSLSPSPQAYVQTTSAPLTLALTSVSGEKGTSQTIGISGGMPPYRAITTATTLIANGQIVNSDELNVSFLDVGGPWAITVQDAVNSSATLFVTTTPVPPSVSISPSAITIPETLPAAINLRLLNGNNPYQVFSSHPGLLSASVSDNGETLLVKSPATPCVSGNTLVTISVIDAKFNIATTAITIQDNGACP
ncbi:MAG TPA: hypothetical protein PK347_15705 [Burkholderiaceae bacterium]|nr:hypothetical protein [Burkholderiaceae bacterium]